MISCVVHQAGGPEVLQLVHRALPNVIAGHVLVKVMAFGLNRAELHARAGFAGDNIVFPRVIGIECVGVVQQSLSTKFEPGNVVAAMMGGMGRKYDGSYQQYALIPEDACHLIKKPANISWKTLAAIPEMFQTTWGSLSTALDSKEGETILVRGGTSSIGLCAIALAKHLKMRVIATSRSSDKLDGIRKSGADEAIVDTGSIYDDVRKLTHGSGVNKVLDLVGTPTLRDSLLACAKGGIVCMTGCLGGWALPPIPDLYLWIPSTVKLTVYGGGTDDISTEKLNDFIELVSQGVINVPIDPHDFNLENLPEAHKLMEDNLAVGKVVCVVKHE